LSQRNNQEIIPSDLFFQHSKLPSRQFRATRLQTAGISIYLMNKVNGNGVLDTMKHFLPSLFFWDAPAQGNEIAGNDV
jgi:hypothetical protein